MSVWNIGNEPGNVLTAAIRSQLHASFFGVIYAGWTALLLCALPLLPKFFLSTARAREELPTKVAGPDIGNDWHLKGD
jgi:hypothetical protein